ncbi:MAG: hypothetical protein ACR2PG_24415, partial [Hyphomicrobiaceae bacterium]
MRLGRSWRQLRVIELAADNEFFAPKPGRIELNLLISQTTSSILTSSPPTSIAQVVRERLLLVPLAGPRGVPALRSNAMRPVSTDIMC